MLTSNTFNTDPEVGTIVQPEGTLNLIKNTPSEKHSDTTKDKDLSLVKLGAGVKFERIRRITGYLVGTTDRFCDAKQAEERERVKHGSRGVILPEGYKAAAE